MLRILGQLTSACDGITRRELLKAGVLSTMVPAAAWAKPASAIPSRAKSLLLIDLFGGPSHIDMFDLKPEAPAEIRGEFRPISTSVPGLRICEHLPELAKRMHHATLIRTLTHNYNSHNPYAVMTGFTGGQDQIDYFAKSTNHPSIPSVCQYLGVGSGADLPGYMMLPAFPGYSQGLRRAGPYGGYLGQQYDPMFSTCEPTWVKEIHPDRDFYDHTVPAMGDPILPKLDGTLTLDVLDQRRSLVEQLEDANRNPLNNNRRRAFELLMAPKARQAFNLDQESPATRDRYGRDLFGSSTLLARRLIEAGVTFVTIHTEAKPSGHWDTHSNNFKMLQHLLLPFLDRAVSALIDDFNTSGLLESTLVVVMGDMGRTPKINGSAGRDHWPQCGFCLMFGGGVKAGYVHGSTDKSAAYPKDHPVTQQDLTATLYRLMGVDPEATVPDHTGRPIPISHGGQVVHALLK